LIYRPKKNSPDCLPGKAGSWKLVMIVKNRHLKMMLGWRSAGEAAKLAGSETFGQAGNRVGRPRCSDLEPLVPGDTRHTISDISRLQALGWEPTIPVEQNVAEYVAWMKEQQGTAEYLEEAERVMRAQGVVREADSGWQTCPEPKP